MSKLPVQAVFFDMDATVIQEESLPVLAGLVGKGTEVAKITEQAMAGHLDFRQALLQRVKMLEGLDASVLNTWHRSVHLSDGIEEFAGFARRNGVRLFLVSGGFYPLAGWIAGRLGFDGACANRMLVTDRRLSGNVEEPIIDRAAKAFFVRRMAAAYGFDLQTVCAVGDGANDQDMLSAVGISVAYRAKANLQARYRAEDFRQLASLLF